MKNKVIITGGLGFLGSHLADKLVELGVVDSEQGIELTFSSIAELSESCKFENCSHLDEPDCAVIRAVESG